MHPLLFYKINRMINYIPKQLKSSLVTHLDIRIHLYYRANSCSTTKGKADK